MSYEEYISKASDDIKQIIIRAIEIYDVIKEKRIPIVTNQLSKMLDYHDKLSGSLFLSCIEQYSKLNIKYKVNIDQTKIDNVFNFFTTKTSEIVELNLEQYKDYYENCFFDLLNATRKNQYKERLDQVSIPDILYSLRYDNICGSDIVSYVYSNTEEEKNSYCELKPYEIIETLIVNNINEITKQEKEKINKTNVLLNKYGEYFTQKEYVSNPAIGRENEIRQLMLALLTPEKSALILGEAGVGKTAIVEGLAYLIKNGKAPKPFDDTKIVKINTSTILSGCIYVGTFEKKVEDIVKELISNKDTILFIDEIHNAVGAGKSEKSDMDLANILKPYLDRGSLRIIGATTFDEYEKIKIDSAFKRRFEIINVLEPKEETVYKILIGTIPKIERATNIKFDFDIETQEKILRTIVECCKPKNRVYNDKINNPDLSLTILKKAFAIASLSESSCVGVDNILESIRSNERIYETSRNQFAENLITDLNTKNLSKTKGIIIPFPSKAIK